MLQENQNQIIEDVHQWRCNHWKHQWAADMAREEEDELIPDDDPGFRNDWDDWYWGPQAGDQ